MLKKMGYSITMSDSLESGQLALIDMKKKTVTIGLERSNKNSWRFSLTHEGGHANLHYAQSIEVFGEDEQTIKQEVIGSKTEYQWLEHHANYFAASMLMPKDVIGYLYSLIYKKTFPLRKLEPLYLGDQPCQIHDFWAVALPMANHLHVSIDALRYRLLNLGLAVKVESSYKRIRNVM
jgi:Zn-dependent peptidase ImmA (M78 family)